jgi:cytochrome b subunit of formate dehydrogenase
VNGETFVRMTRAERWQHGLLVGSFVVLALTGLPLLAGEIGRPGPLGARSGALAWACAVHRGAAVLFAADIVWYLLYSLFSVRGRRNVRDRALRLRDLKDAVAFFDPRSPRPEADRYSFVEKIDFWSAMTGSAIMIATGLFMAAPGLSLRLFPLWLHQVFVVVHGYEAVLAILAVLVGHCYAAHLRPGVFPMSRVWLDGRITAADLERFHPREYRRILEERARETGPAATSSAE